MLIGRDTISIPGPPDLTHSRSDVLGDRPSARPGIDKLIWTPLTERIPSAVSQFKPPSQGVRDALSPDEPRALCKKYQIDPRKENIIPPADRGLVELAASLIFGCRDSSPLQTSPLLLKAATQAP
jgi:hypothetical protein